MSKRQLLDTNLIIRHLVHDDPAQAHEAGRLFDACDRGDITLVVLSAVVAESVFVLESFYNHKRHNIAATLTKLLTSPGIELENKEIHQAALIEYANRDLHFVDCLLAAYARDRNWSVATFDQDLKKALRTSRDVS